MRPRRNFSAIVPTTVKWADVGTFITESFSGAQSSLLLAQHGRGGLKSLLSAERS
ncbi:hypothetical protein [Solibacillus isronensis]|uniref:hypothetical protein n=1 Tax=Solibacillus isronensis TaxID=412383 RepID=UPI00138B030C